MNQRKGEQDSKGPRPAVGIFFVYEDRLLIDTTPLEEAQPYGAFMGHAKGHPRFWRDLQRNDVVPRDVEYDEVARGRVGFAAKERRFHIFMDRCILENTAMVSRIARELNLPPEATAPPLPDSHYRCPSCMKSKEQLEQEEEDWNL